MRNLLILLSFVVSVPLSMTGAVQAQTYYNAPSGYSSSSSTGSTTYYNAPSGGSAAPLNIKGMLRGDSGKSGSRSSYNNRSNYTPNGASGSSYSLALSPQQVAANRAAYEKHKADRQRVKDKQRQEAQASSQANSKQAETQRYLSQIQGGGDKNVTTAPRKRVLYNGNSDSYAMPKRVFNTPY